MCGSHPTDSSSPVEAVIREGVISGSSSELRVPDALSFRYGVFGCGLNLLPLAWPKAELVFETDECPSQRSRDFPGRPPPPHASVHPDEASSRILLDSPVEVLVVDRASLSHTKCKDPQVWHTWMDTAWAADTTVTPNLILQVWPAEVTTTLVGAFSKAHRKLLEKWGYETHYEFVEYTQCGSSVNKQALLVWSSKTTVTSQPLDAGFLKKFLSSLPPRPMSNCLRPPGFGSYVDSPPSQTDVTEKLPRSDTDPMPPTTGAWISTPRGYRQLHSAELGKALGVPSSWNARQDYNRKWVDGLTGLHLWELCGQATVAWLANQTPRASPEEDFETKTPTQPETAPWEVNSLMNSLSCALEEAPKDDPNVASANVVRCQYQRVHPGLSL